MTGVAVMAALLLTAIKQPARVIDQIAYAPTNTPDKIDVSSGIKQTFPVTTDRLSAVAIPIEGVDSVDLSFSLLIGDEVVATRDGPAASYQVRDLGVLASNDDLASFVNEDWLLFTFDRLPVKAGAATWTLSASEPGVFVPYEVDDAAYEGERFVNERARSGNFGFVTLRQASVGERSGHYITNRGGAYIN